MLGLRITDGTTTVTLSDLTTGILTSYQPGDAGPNDEKVTDKAVVVVRGNLASVRATVQAVNKLLQQAIDRQQRPYLSPVYMERDNGDGVWWRSPVTDGALLVGEGGMDRLERSPEVTLAFERRNYWEGAEAQIPLSNGNGTDNTTGLNVFNCNDGVGSSPNKRHNYVQIAAGVIEGDLPAACRLEMTNSYNNTERLYTVWISHNAEADPANFQHVIEAESATAGGTNTSSSSFSNGAYRTFTWGADTQTLIGRWTLDTTYLNHAGGKWFKVIAVFTGSPTAGCRLQCKVTFPSGTPLAVVGSSQEVALGTGRIQEIGMLQLPPWLAGAGDQTPLDLCLYGRMTGGGALGIDFLQLTPVDSYRIYQPQGYGAAYPVRLVDDGIDEVLWTDGWTPAGKTGHYVGVGQPIRLKPGKLQRLLFLMYSNLGSANISRTMSIKLFYRPRKYTV